MDVTSILERIRRLPGVREAFVMTMDLRLRIEAEEGRIRATGGMLYVNRGMEACRDAEVQICVLSDGFITNPGPFRMAMEDEYGNVCGHDACRSNPVYLHENPMWVDDDFVMYPDVMLKSEPRISIMPQKVDFLEEDGFRCTAYLPALTADHILKEASGGDPDSGSVSTVIGLFPVTEKYRHFAIPSS